MSRHAFLLLALAACAAADDTTSAGGRWKTAFHYLYSPLQQQKSSLVLPDGSFLEQFATGAKSLFTDHWIPSQTVKEDIPHQATDAEDNELVKDDKEHFRYRGEWQVEEPRKDALPGAHKGDYGLVLKSAAAHHAISRVLDKPIVFKGAKTVLLQYEVKLQKGLECGGAYIKLLSAPTATESAFVPTKYSDKTPYTIMFGPDKCGTTNKVHFIFRFRNPKTGTIREHHLKDAPMPPSTSNKETHLYTLKIHPEDNTYEVLVDNESKKKGSLMDDFDPPVIPTKEIDDLTDKKPTSWVDLAKIPDPDATKPNDWDETAPKEIEDLDAVKPDDWLENEPEYVPDPDAQKPEDWSDEDDGEWVPLKVNNPKCESISGCGPWTRPMKKNPDYKGKWTSPLIDNPDYKGPWSPRKIPNPEYLDNIHAGYLDAIGAVGFELWTMQNDILFDNILVSNSINDKLLDQLTQSTWVEKHSREVELGKAAATKEFDEHEVRRGFNKKTLPLNEQLRASAFKRFITDIRSDPMGIAVEMPIIAILGMLSTMIPLLLLLSSVFGGGSKGGSRTTTSSTTATVDSTKKNKEQTDSLLKKKQDIDHDDNSSDIDYTATSTENGTTTSSLKLRSKRSNATKSSKKTDEHETDESATEDE